MSDVQMIESCALPMELELDWYEFLQLFSSFHWSIICFSTINRSLICQAIVIQIVIENFIEKSKNTKPDMTRDFLENPTSYKLVDVINQYSYPKPTIISTIESEAKFPVLSVAANPSGLLQKQSTKPVSLLLTDHQIISLSKKS